MSKTFKTDVNYARFHGKKDALPRKAKELADVMDLHWTGTRSGNNRKLEAAEKIERRRAERAKQKREIVDWD